MNQLNKDQKLALLGASLYYMGLGGFLYNSQSTVLAAVRAQYDFPMTRISLYTTMGYVAAVLGTVLFGSMIFRLSQSRKKWYFIGMLSSGALGVFLLACFADTPLFFASFALLSFATSTISIITAYVINQWIRENAGTVIGISAASAGVGGMIGNPVASALLERFSLQNGVLILLAIAVLISGTGIVLMFRKPIPEGDPIPAGQEVKTGGTKPSAKRLLVMSVLLGIVVAGPRTVLLFVSYLSMFRPEQRLQPGLWCGALVGADVRQHHLQTGVRLPQRPHRHLEGHFPVPGAGDGGCPALYPVPRFGGEPGHRHPLLRHDVRSGEHRCQPDGAGCLRLRGT